MCEQCMAEVTEHGEPLPDVLLVRATKDGHQMTAGQWGLVCQNDPFFIFEQVPEPDPAHGLEDPELDTIKDPEPMLAWLRKARAFTEKFEVTPDLGYWLIEQAKSAGFDPETDGQFGFWLWHRMGHLLSIKVAPSGDVAGSGRVRQRVVCTVCRVVLHESTTGARSWIRDHMLGRECAYQRPLRDGEAP